MHNSHAAVWIDHQHARIVRFNRSEIESNDIVHHDAQPHIHHKSGSIGSGHVYEDDSYLGSVAEALRDAEQILVTGPSHVKWQLKAFLALREPGLAKRVASVEALDHPTEAELLAFARKYFLRSDRMRPH